MSSQCTRSLASLLSMLKKRPSGLLASIIILYTLINPFIEARWPSGLRRQLKVNSDTLLGVIMEHWIGSRPWTLLAKGQPRRHPGCVTLSRSDELCLTPQHPERSPRALDDASRRITSGMTSRENHRQPVQPETRVIWANVQGD
ncbi:hypothetical protein KCU96_g20, partial [Aureobasidium melanogenum]